MNLDIYFVGVGGQGVLTLAELITEAAFSANLPVNYFPTEGMAQRGGFVKAQVRLGRAQAAPNIPEKRAHLVLSMEVSESIKALPYVRPGGDFFIWAHVWAPTAVMLGKAGYPSLDQIKQQVQQAQARLVLLDPHNLPYYQGQPMSENLFVLGAAVARTSLGQSITPQQLLQCISSRWPRHAERNLAAFQAGLEAEVETLDPLEESQA